MRYGGEQESVYLYSSAWGCGFNFERSSLALGATLSMAAVWEAPPAASGRPGARPAQPAHESESSRVQHGRSNGGGLSEARRVDVR